AEGAPLHLQGQRQAGEGGHRARTGGGEEQRGHRSRVTAHGRLSGGDAAPADGEHTTVVARGEGFVVEQILSGTLAAPQHYEQDHDEWFVVLGGAAVLEVDGVAHDLVVGDWWLLPAGTPHTLVRTDPGTSWLTVRST